MIKFSFALLFSATCAFSQAKFSPEREAAIKADMAGQIESMKKQAQVMVDSVFSFAELGFQEFETSKYLSGILENRSRRDAGPSEERASVASATSVPPGFDFVFLRVSAPLR